MDQHEPIASILAKLKYRPEQIASVMSVSSSTVSRWMAGTARPRPAQEAKLRRLMAHEHASPELSLFQATPAHAEEALRDAILLLLKEIRETLHRIGRFSSRHEALDEVSKLLFAHFVDLKNGGEGISSAMIHQCKTSDSLIRYTSEIFFRHLPTGPAHRSAASVFTLRLNASDERFAQQMVAAFDIVNTDSIRGSLLSSQGIDILNDTFGSFLADSFVEEKELGQYLTPTEVVRFMVSAALNLLSKDERTLLIDPTCHNNFGYILDPSCGVGSLLAETVKQSRHLIPQANRSKWIKSAAENLLVGIDKSDRMFRLATCNLGLFGFPVTNLYLANGLVSRHDPQHPQIHLSEKVRLILTNPPFGAAFPLSSLTDYAAASWPTSSRASTIDSEILFLERYLDWLMPGGHLVAVVPDSVLTNKGMYASLREFIAKKASIEFVISLPHVTFASAGTSTKTSLLCLQKRARTKRNDAFFAAVCRNVGFDVVTRGAVRRKVRKEECDLPTILKALEHPMDSCVGSWIQGQPSIDRWDASFHDSMARADGEKRINRVRLDAMASLVNERENPARRGTGNFAYIEISDVEANTFAVSAKNLPCNSAPSRARKKVRSGDVLISTVRPDRKTVGVVPSSLDGAICSTGFAVLRPIGVHPLVLAKLMTSNDVTSQLCAHSSGVAYPVFDEAILQTIEVPSVRESTDYLNELATTADEAITRAQTAMDALNNTIETLLKSL